MGESYNNKRHFAVLALIAAIFCCPVRAFAACAGVPSAAQTKQLNLATLQIPAASSTFTVAATAAGTTSGTGTKLYGTAASGQFSISQGSSSQTGCTTVTINVTGTSCGATGCSLGSWAGKWGATVLSGSPPWTGLAMPGAGRTLILGTTATYTSAVSAGTYVPAFTISVNYNSLAPTIFPEAGAIAFDVPLSIDTLSDINIGHVKATTTGTYTISTSGNVTATGSGQMLYGSTSAGKLLIHGSASQTISISAGSYIAGGTGSGVKLSAATCSYDGGTTSACTLTTQSPPTSAGKILLLGITVTVSNTTQAAGSTATPSFTVTVIYS